MCDRERVCRRAQQVASPSGVRYDNVYLFHRHSCHSTGYVEDGWHIVILISHRHKDGGIAGSRLNGSISGYHNQLIAAAKVQRIMLVNCSFMTSSAIQLESSILPYLSLFSLSKLLLRVMTPMLESMLNTPVTDLCIKVANLLSMHPQP